MRSGEASAIQVPEPVFIDSSAWIALFDKNDGRHRRAREYWHHLSRHERALVTSEYVLDETYTLLRRGPVGLSLAIALHDKLSQSRLAEVVEIDEGLRRAAWRLFCRYDDKILSFTDCTSFALMRREGLIEVFGFDRDFERAGFVLRP